MLRIRYILLASLAMALSGTFAAAEIAPLSKEEMSKVVKLDSVTVPTPGELLTALNKLSKPNWQSKYRAPIPIVFTLRPQIALNLGGLIADGYIAIEAEDAQQVKNTGKDIINLAKTLGVSKDVLARGGSINDFADKNEWNTLKEELEATQNEVKIAMTDQHDDELVILVTLGGWIRGTEVVTSWIAENYTPETAKLIRQPALVSFLRSKLAALPAKTHTDPLVQTVDTQLAEIEKLVSFAPEATPTADDVKKLNVAAAALVKEITNKK
jgi:hypothetical protein